MIQLPGHPFQALPTLDGCWIFLSLTQSPRSSDAGIAVLQRNDGKIALRRVVETGPGSTSMAVTHDGKLLIVAHDDGALFFDVARLISGNGIASLGKISDGPGSGSINVAVSADDRYLLVSDERAERITVIDLAKARAEGFNTSGIIGAIPTGIAPIALVFAGDERYLLTTAEVADRSWNWPGVCTPEGRPSQDTAPLRPEGAIVVVDFARAKTNPVNSVLAKVPAGCSPVRLALSPAGDRTYVTARNSNALLGFDTAKLLSGGDGARIASVPVGSSPVGVIVVENGAKIIVTNSNRFAGNENDRQTLTVIDSGKISTGAGAVIGSIPAGAFPRELHSTQDGRTLLLTNFNSNTLEVIDLSRALNH
jgi:DNA-binding beta-propeller fold protein YncE